MIRVGFSTSPAWYSRLIKDVTKSECSHTFIVADFMGVDLVFEEGTFGFTVRTLADLAAHDTIVEIITPKVPLDVGFVASFKQLGQPYGYLVLLGMAFVMLGRKFGKHWKNPLKSAHSMICSERNATILAASGYPHAAMLDAASTSPEDLRQFMHAIEGTGCYECGAPPLWPSGLCLHCVGGT